MDLTFRTINEIGVSIIMPTFNRSSFIGRAIKSVYEQTLSEWELIIINDGGNDRTEDVVQRFENDNRVRYYENLSNQGLGYSLNKGISLAKYNYIAYLPADDVYYSSHLATLFETLTGNQQAILSYSGVKYDYLDSSGRSSGKVALGGVPGRGLQLVQVMHRKTKKNWLERKELVTDDLDRMYWDTLREHGVFCPSKRISAEWVTHPNQRHRIINEQLDGGIYKYKQHYGVKYPVRFQSRSGNYIDEIKKKQELSKVDSTVSSEPLKILLVGELAYNAERICALEERGHTLYGLWMRDPYFYNTTGPLHFGSVIDVPFGQWKEKIQEIQPDIIYGLLNHPAVPFVHEVMSANRQIPFVWHFKESPFYCRQLGIWDLLVDLFEKAQGRIFINHESKLWFDQFLNNDETESMILDGDLPLGQYFKATEAPLLSDQDHEVHTVIPGRPFGLKPEDVGELARHKVHVHLYGDFINNSYRGWVTKSQMLAKDYFHVHPHCDAENWTSEYSKYDAGWLHVFDSANFGEVMRMDWPDLNLPARMSTLAAAGLPMIQKSNAMHMVASQTLTKRLNMGIYFETFYELAAKLKDKRTMIKITQDVKNNKREFSFDFHADRLIDFFRLVIKKNIKTN
ncbi:glycosyltransferase family 2 protein [Albibacterium profundi]|uniref:Glycosyltransferase family A protein n=1 Tax=Albibacterium profundi TaxID=3134906 RepID=A0ABV5CDW0_9SPHI